MRAYVDYISRFFVLCNARKAKMSNLCVCVRACACVWNGEWERVFVSVCDCKRTCLKILQRARKWERERERGDFVRSKERVGHVSVCVCVSYFPLPSPSFARCCFKDSPISVSRSTRESLSPRADLVKQRTKDGPNRKQWNVIIWISLEFYLFLPYIRCS